MNTKLIKRRLLAILAATALTSSCGFAALHQPAQGAGVALKAREVLHPELLALLTDDEIRTVERVMNRQTGKRRINVESIFASNVLPETQPSPSYPANVETIQDCENCPKLAIIPAGSFDRKPILLPGVTYIWGSEPSCAGPKEYENRADATFEYCNKNYWKSTGIGREQDARSACIEYFDHGHGTRECSRRPSASFPDGHFLPMQSDIINVESFALGISEVTIGQFREFVEATNRKSQWKCELRLENKDPSTASKKGHGGLGQISCI